MGRYYDGDISGKFWFGIQSSDAADRFGVIGEPIDNFDEFLDDEEMDDECLPLSYSFDEEHLPRVIQEIKEIEEDLDKYKALLDEFFDSVESYNNEMIIEFFISKGDEVWSTLDKETKKREIEWLLSDYADLRLGYKIKECLEENGYCGFEAEVC
jgi:hypothetical protein